MSWLHFRTGEIEEEAVAHEGNKASRAIFLKNGLVFTTGFTKHSERQYSLRAPGHLDDPIVMVELDTSNGVMFPMYDPDANLIFLCGKGDSVIRYFEITPEPPFVHYINTFQTPDPQRGIGMLCKRGCDVSTCEISRFYRLNNNGFCQVREGKIWMGYDLRYENNPKILYKIEINSDRCKWTFKLIISGHSLHCSPKIWTVPRRPLSRHVVWRSSCDCWWLVEWHQCWPDSGANDRNRSAKQTTGGVGRQQAKHFGPVKGRGSRRCIWGEEAIYYCGSNARGWCQKIDGKNCSRYTGV